MQIGNATRPELLFAHRSPERSATEVGGAPQDFYSPAPTQAGEVSLRDMLRMTRPVGEPEPVQSAAYGRAVENLGGLGMTLADHDQLLRTNPNQPHLKALLEKDRPYAAKSDAPPKANAKEVEQGVLARMGDYLRSECQKLGEKTLKAASNLSKAVKEFAMLPKLAKLSPMLGSLSNGLSVLANSLRGASSQQDPKQVAADFAKALKDLLKLLEKTPLKNLAKAGSKLLPGLGEAVIGWDMYSAGKKSQDCARQGDKAGATAWGVVMALNTLAFSMRGACDVAAAITALTLGGASPGSAPAMVGCEAVVGVLAGASELVAIAID